MGCPARPGDGGLSSRERRRGSLVLCGPRHLSSLLGLTLSLGVPGTPRADGHGAPAALTRVLEDPRREEAFSPRREGAVASAALSAAGPEGARVPSEAGSLGNTVAWPVTWGPRALGGIFISGRFHAAALNYEVDCFLCVGDIKSPVPSRLTALPGRFGIHHHPAVPSPSDKPPGQ